MWTTTAATSPTAVHVEQRIVALRKSLREESILGEYGARAIQAALQAEAKGLGRRAIW